MRVVETAAELQDFLSNTVRPIGLVPTMGYLHQGHMSLVRRARSENPVVAVSIFVNPTQFGPNEDLAGYPRDIPRDLQMCEDAGVDLVFTPAVSEVYPDGHATFVEVEHLQDRWEGAARPGHFRGVASVVAILFRMVQAQRAYFGEKDYQQLQIVKRLARDLHLGLDVIGCPTIRESDGLACSSRNVYLSPEQRKEASALYRALREAQIALTSGQRTASALIQVMEGVIAGTSAASLDYAAVVDPKTLEPIDQVEAGARALIAVHLGSVHLIDNAALLP